MAARGTRADRGTRVLVALWALIAKQGAASRSDQWRTRRRNLCRPFYSKGPNDQGHRLERAHVPEARRIGFGMAALVGIPLGFLIDVFVSWPAWAAPIIALLKPCRRSRGCPSGCSSSRREPGGDLRDLHLQPVADDRQHRRRRAQIPQDYLNVARVLTSPSEVFTKILFPAVLPYMITGVRLSIGVAWLVIVAAEMLTGGVGSASVVGRMEQR